MKQQSLNYNLATTTVIFLISVGIFFLSCNNNENPVPEPIASFEIGTIVDATVSFVNTSEHGASFTWDFGDGNSSSQENPTHTYQGAGSFTVRLTVTNETGSSSASETVSLTGPMAVFSVSLSQATASFTNNSLNATSFSWNFGDGNSSTEENPTHTYTQSGSYTVELTAMGIGTHTTSENIMVTIPNESNLGAVWAEMQTTGDVWPERLQHIVATFDNALWVIGGFSENGGDAASVWKSTDGTAWQQTTPDAGFGSISRFTGQAVAFDNQLWLLDQGVAYNTNDGINWNQAANNLTFMHGRSRYGFGQFDGKLWVIGGERSNQSLNDIWFSSDGINWTEVNPTGDIFDPAKNLSLVEFDNKLWFIGPRNIWNSQDGIAWTQIQPNNGFTAGKNVGTVADGLHQLAALDGRIWVVRELFNGASHANDIWASEDGVNWELVSSNPNFPGRLEFGLTSFQEKLFILGGRIGDQTSITRANDVWVSENE